MFRWAEFIFPPPHPSESKPSGAFPNAHQLALDTKSILDHDKLIAGTIRFRRAPKIALIPYYHRFSQTELFGFIFRTIVDKTTDKTSLVFRITKVSGCSKLWVHKTGERECYTPNRNLYMFIAVTVCLEHNDLHSCDITDITTGFTSN